MRIDYEITKQDFLDAQRLAIQKSPLPLVRWTRLVSLLFGLSLLVFLIYAAARQGFSVRFVPGLAICLLFISMPLLNRRTQENLYKKSTSMHGKLSFDADDEGIRFAGGTFSSKLAWPHFVKYVEDDKVFLLYQNSQVFNLVPKRALSQEQITTLREYLQRNIRPNG